MNNISEKPMREGSECIEGDHDFCGEPICLLCGISYAELYCDSHNGEDR